MLGYIIAFVVCMALFIYFMYDGTLFKKKSAPIQEEVVELSEEKKREQQLMRYLRLKDSKEL